MTLMISFDVKINRSNEIESYRVLANAVFAKKREKKMAI